MDPIRMCVSCRRRAPQASLIRLAVGDSGAVEVAQLRRRGRGAYVCPRRECMAAAINKGAFRRRLRTCADLPAPEQIAITAATVVGSQLQRIARCPTASVQRERLSRLLTELQTPVRSRSKSR
jgi:predicted RNA-binding protein YlxR (DUF448 family)